MGTVLCREVQGLADYYAAEARAVDAKIKELQRERQMKLFEQVNLGNPANKLDLHFLQTGEAVRQLDTFVAERLASLKRGGSQWVEVDVQGGKWGRFRGPLIKYKVH